MARQIAEVRVIRRELAKDQWAVAVRYADGGKEAYPVGDRHAADAEAERLRRAGVKLRLV
jgi:hypothetical protein